MWLFHIETNIITTSITVKMNKSLIPVIHVTKESQALQNVEIAVKAGCSKVFLINHSIKFSKLFRISDKVHTEHPSLWIGVNALDLYPLDVIEKAPSYVKGIWVDNPMTGEDSAEQIYAKNIYRMIQSNRPNTLYFGGVAFKHQKPVTDLKKACELSKPHMDVVTTSGDATGEAAYIGKIASMKAYIGDKPLGIASGITIENVNEYLPYVDYFLVATGISNSFTELCPERTKNLREIVEK